jgi:aminoglycoside phosphotransferase (APT) family kinase protein
MSMESKSRASYQRKGEKKVKELGEPIALGRTAEIYPYGEEKVLKLFLSDTPQPWINKEIEIGSYIQETNIPVPKVYERVKIEEREGVIYERIEGPSLLNELATKPWNVVKYGRLLANLHVQVHDVTAPKSLETQREWATGGIPDSEKISADMKAKVLELLDSLPDGDQLCHGDFHPGNIIITQRGPVIIDWMTVSQGVASGDVARTATILETAKAPEGTPMRWLLEWIRKLFLGTYLKTYLQLRPNIGKSLASWQAVMAANFLADVSIPGEEAGLKTIIEHGLTQ